MLLILLVFLSILVVFLKPKNNDKIFLTADQSYRLLIRDADGYFKSLLQRHLVARKSKNTDEYFARIKTLNFTDVQKTRFGKCMVEADAFFQKDFYTNQYGLKIEKIPWKFALTSGNTYEFGYPHTRTDTIFISDEIFRKNDIDITRTIIHEKIHLDQKLNPEKYDRIIVDMGLNRKGDLDPKRTANPDIDKYDYAGSINVYRHPYEEIAYTIDTIYYKKTALIIPRS
jgi:hypothetical protein